MPDEPKTMMLASLRRMADDAEAVAKEIAERAARRAYDEALAEPMAEVAKIRGAIAAIEGLRSDPIQAESKSPLPSRSHSATIDSMDSTHIADGASKRTRGVPLESNGPYAKVAKLLGVSLAEVGRRLEENVYTVRTWNARKHVPDGIQAKLDALVAAYQAGPKPPKRRGKG